MGKRKLFIDGEWCEGSNAQTIEVENPATGEIAALVCCADTSDLDRVLEAANRGFKIWSRASPWERSKILNSCAALVEERMSELAVLMTQEQGKPLAKSRGELDRTVDVFKWCAGEAIRTYGCLLPQHKPGYRQTNINEPIGPVAPIVPFSTYDEVLKLANGLDYGLAAYAFTRSLEIATNVADDLEAGWTGVNNFSPALAEAPFGGVKDSGIGSEGGPEWFDAYCKTKFISQMYMDG